MIRKLITACLSALCAIICLFGCSQPASVTQPTTSTATTADPIPTIESIGKIGGGQDGAIWGNILFRFNGKGTCNVYDIKKTIESKTPCNLGSFILDQAHRLSPHSNSVMFGNMYYEEGDEFPLLYTNIYNNYAQESDKLEGTTCVYRITRSDGIFTSSLVQIIEIGFTDDKPLWRSATANDIRPYGNFAIDRENSIYYAYTMRDEDKTTRFFSFTLPKATEGTLDETYGVKRVVLTKEHIKDQFDCSYSNIIQGATFHNGKIFSLEGAGNNAERPPKLRVFDPQSGNETSCLSLFDFALFQEPEMVDFWNDQCIYSDASGNLYLINN